jgi:hypothetical protein
MTAPATSLATRVEERLKTSLSADSLTQASAAASQLSTLAFPQDAQLYADLRGLAKQGIKFLEGEYKAIADPMNQALRALRERVTPQKERLERAISAADARYTAWQRDLQAQEARQKREQEQAARDAAAAAQAAVAGTDEEAPPAAQIVTVATPTLVRGATGKAVTLVKRLCVELENVHVVASETPGLLLLDGAEARRYVKALLERGDCVVPEDGTQVVVGGLRCWHEKGVSEK